jgi:hypothetical protein
MFMGTDKLILKTTFKKNNVWEEIGHVLGCGPPGVNKN